MSGAVRSPEFNDKLNPYTFLYVNDPVSWTSPAPGASSCARVGIPSNFERIWEPVDLFHRITIGPSGVRGARPVSTTTGDDSFRILVIGDSAAFGYFVDDDFVFSALAESISLLALPRLRLEVLNHAVPGYSSEQTLRQLRNSIADLRPDMIICSAGTNDARDTATRYPASLKHLSDRELLQALENAATETGGDEDPCAIVERTLGKEMRANRNRKSGLARVDLNSFIQNIEKIIKLAGSADARPVLLLNGLIPQYRTAAEKITGSYGIPVIDTDSLFSTALPGMISGALFPRTNTRMTHQFKTGIISKYPWLRCRIDASHPNPLGHYLIALKLLELAAGTDFSPYGFDEGLHDGFDMIFSGDKRSGWRALASSYPGSIEPLLKIFDDDPESMYEVQDLEQLLNAGDFNRTVLLEAAEIQRRLGKYRFAERLLNHAGTESENNPGPAGARMSLAESRAAWAQERYEEEVKPVERLDANIVYPKNQRHAALAAILPGYGAF